MSKKYHPDINKEPGAEEKYKEIQEAYDTLGDEQKRAAYDQYGPAGANGGFGDGSGFSGFDSSGFGGFEDIFQVSLAAEPLGILMHPVRVMIFNIVLIYNLKKLFWNRKRSAL